MKTKIFQFYFYALSVVTLFWWSLSHWLYPEVYHRLLGFERYDPAMVKIIGTLSFFAVLGMFFVARDPVRNRDFFISLMVMSGLMAGTYFFLIQTDQFPIAEYLNIIVLLGNGIISSLLYPWEGTLKPVAKLQTTESILHP
jgi:hypothetical protein